jgi:hypothetical protein
MFVFVFIFSESIMKFASKHSVTTRWRRDYISGREMQHYKIILLCVILQRYFFYIMKNSSFRAEMYGCFVNQNSDF